MSVTTVQHVMVRQRQKIICFIALYFVDRVSILIYLLYIARNYARHRHDALELLTPIQEGTKLDSRIQYF